MLAVYCTYVGRILDDFGRILAVYWSYIGRILDVYWPYVGRMLAVYIKENLDRGPREDYPTRG